MLTLSSTSGNAGGFAGVHGLGMGFDKLQTLDAIL
jgi:hypothetical protein